MKEVFFERVNLVAMFTKCLFCFLLLSPSHLLSLQRPLIFLLKCLSGLFLSLNFYSHQYNPYLCQEVPKGQETGKRTLTIDHQNNLRCKWRELGWVVPKVWSPHQQHQHHLGTYINMNDQALSRPTEPETPRSGPAFCVFKFSRWFWCS